MQLTSIIIGALPFLAAALPEARVKYALVYNNCAHTVFVQNTINGANVGPVHEVKSGDTWRAKQQLNASTRVFAAKTKAFKQKLAMDFTQYVGANDQLRVTYDLGDYAGNPFFDYKNTLLPRDESCGGFTCKPKDEYCYSNPSHQYEDDCAATNLAMTLCA